MANRTDGQAATMLVLVAAILGLAGTVAAEPLELSALVTEVCRVGAAIVAMVALAHVTLVRAAL